MKENQIIQSNLSGCSVTLKPILLNTGEEIKYSALHSRLSRKYGNAKKCVFCNSQTAKRFEWAILKDKEYSLNINDYLELCPSCHRKYDMTDELRLKLSKNRKGKRNGANHPMARKVIDLSNQQIYLTLSHAAIATGIKRTTLCMMLMGHNKNRTNLIYYET